MEEIKIMALSMEQFGAELQPVKLRLRKPAGPKTGFVGRELSFVNVFVVLAIQHNAWMGFELIHFLNNLGLGPPAGMPALTWWDMLDSPIKDAFHALQQRGYVDAVSDERRNEILTYPTRRLAESLARTGS